ncbi:MAG: ImmA/IrrE family metallo-endopeptidase [Gemmatimonadetes bacterium]|nr:ImmA/IrrE family metallo-endopeptidase [Gemmatimonadota bacterium]
MIARVIRNRSEYDAALAEIGRLVDRDPAPGTPDGERLELLTVLARDYESRTLPRVTVDPVDAIQFRMEQQGLRQKDLVPYIGSKSKVSEVLAGKRPLTLAMIRSLHGGLGIPAEALLGQRDPALLEAPAFEWKEFPLVEMAKRHWITASSRDLRAKGEELLRQFLAPLGKPEAVLALYRQTGHVRSGRHFDQYALIAWTARIVSQAEELTTSVAYRPGSITLDVMREIARLSWSDHGPRLAQEFLAKRLGIPMIVERHLPGTHLDGAAIQGPKGPVIGITLRYDRLDNFWFCLFHELVHVDRHFTPEASRFYDDLDSDPAKDAREQEADDVAGEALIPREEWEDSPARLLHSPEAVIDLATKLNIHPAIVAGRIRHESGRFRVLSGMVGHGRVRNVFSE